jgi:hypothetical protein
VKHIICSYNIYILFFCFIGNCHVEETWPPRHRRGKRPRNQEHTINRQQHRSLSFVLVVKTRTSLFINHQFQSGNTNGRRAEHRYGAAELPEKPGPGLFEGEWYVSDSKVKFAISHAFGVTLAFSVNLTLT